MYCKGDIEQSGSQEDPLLMVSPQRHQFDSYSCSILPFQELQKPDERPGSSFNIIRKTKSYLSMPVL